MTLIEPGNPGHHNEDPAVRQTIAELEQEIARPGAQRSATKSVLFPVIAVMVLMGAGFGLGVYYLNGKLSHTQGQLSSQGKELARVSSVAKDNTEVANKLADQLNQHGIKPSATPSAVPNVTPVPGPTGATGATGRPGKDAPAITSAQLQNAIQACFAANECAASPTTVQLVSAVDKYCNIHGQCQGPPGQSITGAPGSPGATVTGPPGATVTGPPGATVTGPAGPKGDTGDPGPAPTDAQVLGAVTTYCSGPTDPCKGYPSTISIVVPDPTITDPNATKTETCTPDDQHVYTCQ